MLTKVVSFVAMAVAAVVSAFGGEADRFGPIAFGKPEIVPAPVSLAFETNTAVFFGADCPIAVVCPDKMVSKWVADHLKRWYGFAPSVISDVSGAAELSGDEAYAISAKQGRITIRANALAGVRHALSTLRQMIQCVPDGDTVSGWWLPACEIKDSPALKFRGFHVCWFPEISPVFIERMIRLAAYYKYNYVVIETWGTFRSERHPWWGWPDGKMTKSAIRRLCAIADDLGVTLIPQFNVFGHASMSRGSSGKHASLDLDPSRQPLFEPDGWNWCLSNPSARRIVRELVVELHEAFGSPPFFHIGCDEAQAPGCARCRAAKPYATLVAEHIVDIRNLLKSRGAQAMMWHDMLLERGDSRWNGFYANGSKDEAAMVAKLPRDIVICDWFYGNNYGGNSAPTNYPTLTYFQQLGFPTLTCPWNDRKATLAQGAYAVKHGLFGLLETSWHHTYKGELPYSIIAPAASAAWGTPADVESTFVFARHWRQVGWDMKVRDYREFGFVTEQVPSSTNVEIKPGG